MAEVAVTLVGRVGQQPILRTGNRGDWTSFTVATNPRWKQGEGYVDGPTSWFSVNANGDLAQHVVDSIAVGQQVIVHGTVSVQESVQDNGAKTRYVNVRATAVGPDLRFGTARFTKAGTGPQQQPAQQSRPLEQAVPQQPQQEPERQSGDWGGPPPERQPALQSQGWPSSGFAADEETPF